MARSGSNVVLTVVVVVIVGLGIVAGVVGPRIYREGKAMVQPIAEMAKAEERLAALNEEFPYDGSGDGLVSEERLTAFLDVRRSLKPKYEAWDAMVREVESKEESWDTAKVVIAQTSQVMTAQIDLLQAASMSQNEFRHLEVEIYERWLGAVTEAEGLALDPAIRTFTEDDLAFVAGLRAQHGESPPLEAMDRRLRERLDAVNLEGPPAVDGVPAANAALYWERLDEIRGLDLADNDLHSALRDGRTGDVNIQLGSENDTTIVIGDESPGEDRND
jgi:hypothetical protein